MQFKDSLWDDSEPDYAPGIMYSKKIYPRWKAPAKYVKAGYSITSMKLPGTRDDEKHEERAALCREYTRDMVRWWNDDTARGPDPDTWAYLIARYKGDEFSPMNINVKANTRRGYMDQLKRIEDVWGDVAVEDTDFEMVMRVKQAMEQKGRSLDFIKRHIETLRRVARYGKARSIKGAMEALSILEEVKTRTPPPRSTAPTREQILAIVGEAGARGLDAFATGILIQYELSLRAVDVRGHWLDTKEDTGITRRSGGKLKRWQDGLTWEMFDKDFKTLSKVISKTAKSMPEKYVFDLTLVPEIQERIARLYERGNKVGPVIVSGTGEPYEQTAWTRMWSRIRDHLKLPKDILCMDLRAAGITEAQKLGVAPTMLRNAAQHKSQATTDRYLRARSDDANNVVALRRAGR